jgi:ribosome maturation factor RimP
MIISTREWAPRGPLFLFSDYVAQAARKQACCHMVEKDEGALAARFIHEKGQAAEIASLVEPVLEGLGFRLVRVQLGGRDAVNLQIMAERPDGTMNIDDCETISKQLSPVLDVADLISEAYRLEVSSPGIDRPLVRPIDFETWAGYEARIELSEPIDGRRRFRGKLEGFEDGEVRLFVNLDQVGETVIGLPLGLIGEARLVLTDELVRESLRRSKARADSDAGGAISDGSEAPDGMEDN